MILLIDSSSTFSWDARQCFRLHSGTISAGVSVAASLCTLVPKRGQSSLNCRITVAETAAAVKKEKFSRERGEGGEENKKGTANPFSTISFLCINWSSYRYACTVIRHCSYSRMNKRQIAQDPLFERHAFSDFERWMYVE